MLLPWHFIDWKLFACYKTLNGTNKQTKKRPSVSTWMHPSTSEVFLVWFSLRWQTMFCASVLRCVLNQSGRLLFFEPRTTNQDPPPTASFPQVKTLPHFWCCGCIKGNRYSREERTQLHCWFTSLFFSGGESLIYMFLCLQSSLACVHKWTTDVNYSSRHITNFQGCQEGAGGFRSSSGFRGLASRLLWLFPINTRAGVQELQQPVE